MLSRALFIVITLFWLTMNVLLWRAEVGSRSPGVSSVPAELVWEKILTSPDSSSLSAVRHGKKIGFCQWITGAGETWATVTDNNLPAGAPRKTRTYRLQIEGSVVVPEWTNRIRFEVTLKVDHDRQWDQLDARVSIRPCTWQIHTAAAEQTVRLTVEDAEARVERSFKFSDLQHPGTFLSAYLGSSAGEWLNELEGSRGSPNPDWSRLVARWEASEDTLWIGHAQVRVYRVQTWLLDRYRIAILVSRVGEILRVELPGELVLVNDQLTVL